MIRLDVEQGSAEWIAARLGIPTASAFGRLVTPKGAPSKSAEGYMCELLAERLTGYSQDSFINELMERGNELEDQAVKFYELQQETDTEKIGHCLLDDRSAGCSPDRLVGDDGGLEIKCPALHTHIGYMLGTSADKYRPQVQGCLWVTGRQWWDWLSYHPELPPVLVRFEREEEYIEILERVVRAFNRKLADAQAIIEARMPKADAHADPGPGYTLDDLFVG